MSAPSSSKPWNEAFEDYFRWSTTGPQTVGIDLGASPHAPMASHPVLWRLTLPLKNPMSNGLRDSDEKDAVFAVQDALAACLRPLGLLMVGHLVEQGAQVVYLYGPKSVSVEQVLPLVQAHQGAYDVGVARTRDARWTAYLRTLFPAPLQYQVRLNRQRVALLRTEGDLLEVPRDVAHRAHFPWERQAEVAEAWLRDQGFEGFERQPVAVSGMLMWRLDFHRVDTVDEARVDEVSEEILGILESHEGTYDGWGCLLVTELP
ncbi:DUF695 domain-containing protein [Corallococcus aberystwythensis]|uniref:DUF695 domain-containing protein n=1 Tax=Corallococcus aberystwythensis TaxID=2316722 RepID=A0A3A8PDB1_9BACT|nr:DUF695 domain-containing protein [Corallococcus aberystwythensis]RKH53939.1 DUF695 domain-containing protein [Corallococcus aberystwythensis]